MSVKPTLLFLHGVGEGDPSDGWAAHLSRTLVSIGYPDLDSVRVIAPKYPHTLRGSDDTDPLPKLTIKELNGAAARANQRDFERRIGAIEVLLGPHNQGSGWALGDAISEAAVGRPSFIQAGNFITDPRVRAQVLNRVLRQLPSSGRLVIVGHSLGSVIAADLIRRLPEGLDVAGMVTIGSPLAHRSFHVDKMRTVLKDPPQNLAWWVNVWNKFDPVTTHRGISTAFPWMIDYQVQTGLALDVHDAATYLDSSLVGTAIGYALFGSQSKAVSPTEVGVDVALDYAESIAVAALRYAHLISQRLKGERQERYTAALRQVQGATVDRVKHRNASQSRPIPAQIAQLAVDLSDPDSIALTPPPISFASKQDAILPLLSIVGANVIAPFEIEVPRDVRQDALEQLTREMGIGSRIGTNAFKASESARDALRGPTNWFKWVALGVGAAAVIAATGGLALAAAPGLAGAAAVTSALAAFGPGGMIGGLLTAGTLLSAGGGGVAIGLASPATTAAALEAVVEARLAAALLRQLEGIEQDPSTWSGLNEIGAEVRRELARIQPFSDESAPSVKELHRKSEAIDRALECLRDRGLGEVDEKIIR